MRVRDLLVRVVLAPLPRRLKRRFGPDLRATAADAAADAWARGGSRGLLAWVGREFRDAVNLAAQEPSRPAPRHAPEPPTPARRLSDLGADLRHALRLARRKPAFAASTVATLGVAMCATTTVLALTTAVLWRPMPFPDEGRLVLLWESVRDGDPAADVSRVTSGTFTAWREAFSGFEALAAFGSSTFTAIGAGDAVRLAGARVTADYFRVLGLPPLVGRWLTPEDEEPGRDQVIVLSEALWHARFAGRADAIGQTLRLDDTPYTVVGVMPAAVYPGRPITPATLVISAETQQYWIPIARTPAFANNLRSHLYAVIGRLQPGVSLDQAVHDLRAAEDASGRSTLGDGHGVSLTPLRDQLTRDVRPLLLIVLAAIAAVLLICCANLASLYALHVDARGRELAVRSAIGATDWRLSRQLLAESLALSSAGSLAGIAGTYLLLPLLPAWLPEAVPLVTRLVVDWRVLAIGGGLALAISLLLATWPLLRLGRIRSAALRGVSAATPMRGHGWLVTGELALALTLAIAAGLLGRSLVNAGRQDPGFEADRLLTFEVQMPASRARDLAEVAAFERRLGEALRRTPGVQSVAFAYDSPLEANWIDVFTFAEDTTTTSDARQSAWLRIVSPEYFATTGTRVIDGRVFDPADDVRRPGLVIVNRAFVAAFLRDRPVLGTRLRTRATQGTWGDAAPSEFTIAGVVADERFRGLEQPTPPAFYLSTAQFPQSGVTCLIRTAGDPRAVGPLLVSTVRAVDPQAPVSRTVTMREAIDDQLGNRRVTTELVLLFGAAAVLLAAIGLYGLLSLVVASRVREIGVRIALGARPAEIARAVVAQAMGHAAAGIAIGLLGAWAITRIIASLLFNVRPFDPATMVGGAAVLAAVAALAAWRPARRAARIDPVDALRTDV